MSSKTYNDQVYTTVWIPAIEQNINGHKAHMYLYFVVHCWIQY